MGTKPNTNPNTNTKPIQLFYAFSEHRPMIFKPASFVSCMIWNHNRQFLHVLYRSPIDGITGTCECTNIHKIFSCFAISQCPGFLCMTVQRISQFSSSYDKWHSICKHCYIYTKGKAVQESLHTSPEKS